MNANTNIYYKEQDYDQLHILLHLNRIVGIMLLTNIQIAFSLLFHLRIVSSTVWLRNPNERGPTSVNAGTKCLSIMSKYYFSKKTITRTANVGFFHSINLSAPAVDIELNFLVNIHSMIANETIDGLQIRIISDAMNIDALVDVEPRSVMLTDFFVFVVDDVAKFHSNMRNIVAKSSSWNPGARFLILFNNPDLRIDAAGCNGIEVASKIFELMYSRFNAARVVILYASGIKTYNVYVTNPYKDEKDCRTLKPILIDECDNGMLKNGMLTKTTIRATRVPERVPACTFTFCAKENEPYMNENCTSGLEIDIIRTLQGFMKFKTKTICSTLPRGEVFHNGSWTGLLGLLRNDKCDFVVGGFFPDNEVHEDFGETTTYFEDTYTWFIYLAPFRSPWKGIIEIFESETWLLLIMTLFIAGLSWFIFGKAMAESNSHKRLVLCVMNSLAVVLGISSNNRPNYTPLRIFFILLALYGLNITTIYTSKLITVFTQPAHDQQISTIKEILETGIPIGGREEYSDWFENDNPLDQIISKKYNFSSRFQPTVENMKLVRDGHISVLSNRIFVLSHDLQDDIFGLPGNVFSNPIEMTAERGFPLITKFNSLINRMKDAGLISKIYNDFLYNKTILDFIRHRQDIRDVGTIPLTIQHLQGAFAMLIVGLIFSLVVFLIEVMWNSRWFKIYCEKIMSNFGRRSNRLIMKLRLEKKPLKLRKKL